MTNFNSKKKAPEHLQNENTAHQPNMHTRQLSHSHTDDEAPIRQDKFLGQKPAPAHILLHTIQLFVFAFSSIRLFQPDHSDQRHDAANQIPATAAVRRFPYQTAQLEFQPQHGIQPSACEPQQLLQHCNKRHECGCSRLQTTVYH